MDHNKEMLGEFADDDTPVLETPVEEAPKPDDKPDTVTETAPADTETETVQPSSELDTLKKFGLDGKFHSLDDALASIPHQNRRIADIERSNKEMLDRIEQSYKRQLTPSTDAPAISPEQEADELLKNPSAFFERKATELGYVKKTELEPIRQTVQEIGVTTRRSADAQIAAQFPELADIAPILAQGQFPDRGKNKMFDAIDDFSKTPAGDLIVKGSRSTGEAIAAIYQLVKPTISVSKEPIVERLTPEQKAAATTSGGKTRGVTKKTLNDYTDAEIDKLNAHDLEKLLYENGRIEREALSLYKPV